ncbi:MAG: RNA methyltransferase substrate-binding domain-containing protein, partial [Shewanella oncorhynchi]
MKKQDIIFGIHAVEALLKHSPERIIELWLLQGRDDERLAALAEQAKSFGTTIQMASRKVLDDKSENGQHQGIIARVKAAKILNEQDLDVLLASTEQPFLLILDGVTDPHNLGACLR